MYVEIQAVAGAASGINLYWTSGASFLETSSVVCHKKPDLNKLNVISFLTIISSPKDWQFDGALNMFCIPK